MPLGTIHIINDTEKIVMIEREGGYEEEDNRDIII